MRLPLSSPAPALTHPAQVLRGGAVDEIVQLLQCFAAQALELFGGHAPTFLPFGLREVVGSSTLPPWYEWPVIGISDGLALL